MHFLPGMGCGASTFGEAKRRGSCCMILRRILIVLGCIIFYPLAVILGPSIYLTVLWVVNFYEVYGTRAAVIAGVLFPIPFIIGLIFDIFWIPLAIIGLPTVFVLLVLKQVVDRYQNKQKAMQRI